MHKIVVVFDLTTRFTDITYIYIYLTNLCVRELAINMCGYDS